jgi:hypothetical protein
VHCVSPCGVGSVHHAHLVEFMKVPRLNVRNLGASLALRCLLVRGPLVCSQLPNAAKTRIVVSTRRVGTSTTHVPAHVHEHVIPQPSAHAATRMRERL